MRRSLLIGLAASPLQPCWWWAAQWRFSLDNEKWKNTLTAGTVEAEINEHEMKHVEPATGGNREQGCKRKKHRIKGNLCQGMPVPQWLNEAERMWMVNLSVGT